MSSSPIRIVVLTDSKTHEPENSIFPLVRELAKNASVSAIYIVDRQIPANRCFFEDKNKCISALYGFPVDKFFNYRSYKTTSENDTVKIPLKNFDVVFFRIDHPVSEDFFHYCRALLGDKICTNAPEGLAITGNKKFLIELVKGAESLFPPMALCTSVDDVIEFARYFRNGIVLKTLTGFGGYGVVRYRPNQSETDLQTPNEIVNFLNMNGAVLAMRYLAPDRQSDNRVLIFQGKILGAIQRVPGTTSWQCNTTAGGLYRNVDISDRERSAVTYIDPILSDFGISLYGIDFLLDEHGNRLISEINTLNVGMIWQLEKISGIGLTQYLAGELVKIWEQGLRNL